MASGGYDPAIFEKLFALEANSFWYRGRSDLINWALDKYFPHARSFLELGCGNAYVLDRVRQLHPDWHLVGTELFEEGLVNARVRMPAGVELRQLDATQNPYEKEFDVAGAFDVIEHVEEAPAVLKGMFHAVRPGGGVLITVPQHQWLWSAADVAAHHVKRYTRRDLTQELQDAGFEPLRITSFVSLLLPAMMAARLTKKQSADVEGELGMAAPLNAVCYKAMQVENVLIKAGVPLPAGGSLLAVARRPS
ncbi:class I SAM-dependent methyltransferase [Kribbella sp. NPDC051770]|uniref:class I SAM-dependent methyltransferase n=1 Tax=Kribbella sp. NPDC051770 TaxID=3155413 RepID=UPI0034234D6E